MAMEVNGNYNHYANHYKERVQAEQNKTNEDDRVEKMENSVENKSRTRNFVPATQSLQASEKDRAIKIKSNPIPQDAYISSEKSGSKPTGLYHLGQDADGKPKVVYDDPKKAEKTKAEPEKKAEKCTTNTDGVDREIEKLKDEKKQLEQQIRLAADDEEKVKELKNKLAQIEGEISQKDHDGYRRQNGILDLQFTRRQNAAI